MRGFELFYFHKFAILNTLDHFQHSADFSNWILCQPAQRRKLSAEFMQKVFVFVTTFFFFFAKNKFM